MRRAVRSDAGQRRRSGLAKAGYAAATIATVLVVAATLFAYGVYRHLNGNLQVTTVSGLTHRSVYGVQNILVLGSQTRDGQGRGFGHDPGTNLSDNLILIHLDATHTHATILSIPRDTMVYEPGCEARRGVGTGIWGPYPSAIIDGAMNIGGPSCAVHTVEDLTGIKVDHFIEFNFNSFRAMVDALGGVDVCVPPSGYNDPYSHLHLKGGLHLLKYNQALAYVRTRHGVGNGGDLGRIQLQQAFISSVIQKVTSQGLLSNLGGLYKIADLATKALTVDQGLGSVSKLLHLAETVRHLRTKDVTFITMPTILDPANIDRLLPVEPQDEVVFRMLQTSTRWRHHLPKLPPAKVAVRVLNGSGVPHLAARTAAGLRKLGFDVVNVGDAPAAPATTVTYSGNSQADDAYTLMSALATVPAGQNLIAEPAPQTGKPGPVTLIIGTDFAGLAGPRAHHAHASGPTVQTRNAAQNLCSGLPAANPDPGTPP